MSQDNMRHSLLPTSAIVKSTITESLSSIGRVKAELSSPKKSGLRRRHIRLARQKIIYFIYGLAEAPRSCVRD